MIRARISSAEGATNTAHELAMALRTAYLAMHRQAEAVLAPGGATAEQFVVLSALAEREAVTQQELVGRTGSDPNTLRAILVLLERKGWIQRRPHPTDGRARSVSLTEEGRQRYGELLELGETFRARLLAAFEAEEAATLMHLLQKARAVMTPGTSTELPG